jgi:hypothetical protein
MSLPRAGVSLTFFRLRRFTVKQPRLNLIPMILTPILGLLTFKMELLICEPAGSDRKTYYNSKGEI